MVPIKNCPGYFITEKGEVYRLPNKISDGKNAPSKVLCGTHLRGGGVGNKRCYESVNISLRDTDGNFIKQKRYYVHRLVAETFIDNPHRYPEVDHINQDKLDNRVENLRWVSKSENQQNRPDNK